MRTVDDDLNDLLNELIEAHITAIRAAEQLAKEAAEAGRADLAARAKAAHLGLVAVLGQVKNVSFPTT